MQALRSGEQIRKRWLMWDEVLIAVLATLTTAGFVMMGSASMDYAAESTGDPFFHINRQAIYILISIIVMRLVMQVPIRIWEHGAPVLLMLAMALLVLVLVPGVGREVKGAQRWIGFGVANLQPSELMKVAFVVFVAAYMKRRQLELRTRWTGMIKPLVVLAVVVALLLAEPDFGASVVIAGTTMGMLFVGGARLIQFLVFAGFGGVLAALMVLLSPYRMQRLVTYLDPWADQFNSGYQLTQALIAFGRGEWIGEGLGNSVQKLFYLPEAHTDFVFAIIGEELGLMGCLLFLSLFAALIARILGIAALASQSERRFQSYLCTGAALLIASQVFINVGVNSGLLPTKGLTLPLLSYGGSSLIGTFALLGMVLRVEFELRVPEGTDIKAWRLRHV